MDRNRKRIAIMGGARTPFAKAGTAFKGYSALELSVHAINGLLEKQELDPNSVDELAYGIVVVDPAIPQMAREVNFASELPANVRSITLTDNCITGASAIAAIHDSIVMGRTEVGIAGGVESMSKPPVLFPPTASHIFL